MSTTIDAKGMACPKPVMLTARAMKEHDVITTLVDNQVAVENVFRLARSRGFVANSTQTPGGFAVELIREGAKPAEVVAPEPLELISCQPAPVGPTVVLAMSNTMGQGSDELGERLMGAFFHSLQEVESLPATLIFVNSGVRLVIEGSRCLEDLKELASRGVDIMACGTCLGYYELTEQLRVGRISNMYDIASTLLDAGKVVRV